MSSTSPRPPSLGRTISDQRKKLGMSQKELAEKTRREDGEPISPQFLNDIERDRRRPGAFILNALAEQLKLNPDELHLIAGQLPPDVVERGADADRMKRVMEAFRRAYKR